MLDYTSDANLVDAVTDRIEAGMVHIQFTDRWGRGALAVRRIQGNRYGSREMSERD